MQISELDFQYPDRLIATERRLPGRIMLVEKGEPRELVNRDELIGLFDEGDLLVINETRVLRRRVFAESGFEILFLEAVDGDHRQWRVLCPSSRWKAGTEQILPGGFRASLIDRGRIQTLEVDRALDDAYFERNGELPLPPYIQKARGERRNREGDVGEYQTAWAKKDGSLAAPTASLHFTNDDLGKLRERGVGIAKITLHVGLGTFLPITVDSLDQHEMHSERIEISPETWRQVLDTKARGAHVWALGTTVVRSLESASGGLLANTDGGHVGESKLFITPGFEFKIIDRLLTNFHQPRTTLIALVGAFAGLETVKRAYAWAIEREFRLFSYGDLTVWKR